MNGELLDQCQAACADAMRAGATDAEVYAQHSDEVSVSIEKHDVQLARSSCESTFGVRVLVGNRMGFSSTNALAEMPGACRDAVALAKASPGDPHNRLAEPQDLSDVRELFDETSSEFSVRDAVRRAADMLRVAESIDRRLIVGDGGFSSVRSSRAIANTRGVAAAERTTLFSHHVLVTAKDDERVSSMDLQYGASRRARDVDVVPAVTLACRNALESLGSAPGETFQGTAIFSPSAVLDLVVGPLLFHANGRNALRGLSRWREHVGRQVASATLSVRDDGTISGGVGSSAFDREGVPHAPLSLVDCGRLTSFLHNGYSSSAFGSPTTGHAAGTASSLPMIGPTNLSIEPGTTSIEELIAGTTRGLLVGRFSGNVDPISGDFSGVAKAAHLVRGGRRVAAVSGSLVAGNVFEALAAIAGISSETQQIYGFTLPHVIFERVSVTAG